MRWLLMKLRAVFCCSLLVIMTCTEWPTHTDGRINCSTWETTWGGPGYQEARCALAVDGGVIVGGKNSIGDGCAVMFDGKTGSPVWEMLCQGTLPGNVVDIVATPERLSQNSSC